MWELLFVWVMLGLKWELPGQPELLLVRSQLCVPYSGGPCCRDKHTAASVALPATNCMRC